MCLLNEKILSCCIKIQNKHKSEKTNNNLIYSEGLILLLFYSFWFFFFNIITFYIL